MWFVSWLRSWFARRTTVTTDSGTDTEFTAEVVRITEILPHPNADRLQIAKFELTTGPSSYEVIVGKGEFRVGDLAGYFSVDCIVPMDRPEFEFLKHRLDGAGKTHFRLKAARLRGVFSQGLLTRVTDASLGESLAACWGITYHRPPEVNEATGTTVNKPRPQPFPVYGVDSLKKLPRLFNEGEQVVITEKIHGTNFRFGWVRKRFLGIPYGWKFVVGSHRAIKTPESGGGFYGEDLWTEVAKRRDLAHKIRDYRGYVFYGELYGYTYSGQKIQDLTYGGERTNPQLAMFDVRTPGGSWLSAFEREAVLADVGLPSVPLLYIGEYTTDTPSEFSEGMSTIAPKQIREGCVIESLEGQRRKAKFVGQGYLLRKDS